MSERQLTIAGCEAEVTPPKPGRAEQREIRRLEQAWDLEQIRRHNVYRLEQERLAWRQMAERSARRRRLTPEQQRAERAEQIEQNKLGVILESIPDVAENRDADRIWQDVHEKLNAIIKSLPDKGDDRSWNTPLVSLGIGFVARDYDDE